MSLAYKVTCCRYEDAYTHSVWDDPQKLIDVLGKIDDVEYIHAIRLNGWEDVEAWRVVLDRDGVVVPWPRHEHGLVQETNGNISISLFTKSAKTAPVQLPDHLEAHVVGTRDRAIEKAQHIRLALIERGEWPELLTPCYPESYARAWKCWSVIEHLDTCADLMMLAMEGGD